MMIAVLVSSGCVQEGQLPTLSCTPDWQCGKWIDCARTGRVTGIQTRTCLDANNCNTTADKPTEQQTCTLPPIATKEPSAKSVVDNIYKRNADRAAWEAIDYCKKHPYGTYRTTIYNAEGFGVPFKIECSTLF